MLEVASGATYKDTKTGFRSRTIIRGGEGAANRTLAMLAAIFEFAIRENLMNKNPASRVKKFPSKPKERFLSDAEMTQLGLALQNATDNGANIYAINAIKLLLLTGCRKGEILSLKWTDIDTENNLLKLTDSKTGAKAVYLASAAKDLILEIPKLANTLYVFPNCSGSAPYAGLQKVWNKVRTDCGLKDVRLHDLRHSFASVGARNGQSMLMLGKLLGHSKVETTQIYSHFAAEPVFKAANDIGEYIGSLIIKSEK